MRVLVTGHLGYIGTVLTPLLVRRGYDVVGLDSDLYRRCTFGATPPVSVPRVRKDVRDVEREDLAGFDAVLGRPYSARQLAGAVEAVTNLAD